MTGDFYRSQCPVTSRPCKVAQLCTWGCWIERLPPEDRAKAVELQDKAIDGGEEPIVGMRIGEWKEVEIAFSLNGNMMPQRFAVTAAFVVTGQMVNFEIDRRITFETTKTGHGCIHVFHNGHEILTWEIDEPLTPGNAFSFGPAKN